MPVNLKKVREDMSLSQQEIADAIGVSVVTVSRWENGHNSPSPYLLSKLCSFLERSCAELFPDLVSGEQITSTTTRKGKGSVTVSAPNKLRLERIRLGLSQEMVAEELKVPRTTVSRWEQGHATPRRYYMRRLCKLLKKRAEELFPAKTTPHPPMVQTAMTPTKAKDTQGASREDIHQLSLIPLSDHVIENLRDVRHKMGLTQDNIAEWLDVDRRTYQRWESGESIPRSGNRFRIQQLLYKLER